MSRWLCCLMLLLTQWCCVASVSADDISSQTAELLRQAQAELDAGRLINSLKTVAKIRPEENERNRLQWPEYYPDLDGDEVLEALEKNEFYLKDRFLVALAERCLERKASPGAVQAARLIGQDMARNRLLSAIVEAQVKAAREPNNDASEMLAKALETASHLDADWSKTMAYGRIATILAMAEEGFSGAIEAAKNIPDRKKRDDLLLRFASSQGNYPKLKNVTRIDDKEETLKAVIEITDNLASKCSVMLQLANFYCENETAPEKCREYLPAILDVYRTVEGSRFSLSVQIAELYRRMNMDDEAAHYWTIAENQAAEQETPYEKFNAWQTLINRHNNRKEQLEPSEWSAKHDQLIRRAAEAAGGMEGGDKVRLISLLNQQPTAELYGEIRERILATPLSVREKIDLAHHDLGRYQRPGITPEERVTGFETGLVPLLSDIGANPGEEWQYAAEHSCRMLSEVFRILYEDGQFDAMTGLIDSGKIPEPLSQQALVIATDSRISRSNIADVEPIESLFLSRITDATIKTELRSRLQRRFGAGVDNRLNWDGHLASAKNIADEEERFEAYCKILRNPVPEDLDISPLLDEMRTMAQDDAGGIRLERAMKLLNPAVSRHLMIADEKSQWVAKIEAEMKKIPEPEKRFRMKRSLILTLYGSRSSLPDEAVREGQLTQALALAQAVPESMPGERLNAYWLTAQLGVQLEMPAFAGQVVEEGLAFAETLPDQGRRPMQTLSPLEQLEEIQENLTGISRGER